MYLKGNCEFIARQATQSTSLRAVFLEMNYVILPWIVCALCYGETQADIEALQQQRVLDNISVSVRPNIVLRFGAMELLNRAESATGRLWLDFAN